MSKPTPTGFAGLASNVPDVDATIAAADRASVAPRQTHQPAQPSVSTQSRTATSRSEPAADRDDGAVATGLKKVGGWVLGIGVVIILKLVIFGGIHALAGAGSTPNYQSSDATTTTEMAPAAAVAEDGSGTEDGQASTDASAADPSLIAPVSTPEEPYDDGTSMMKPAFSTTTLSMPELRYCLAEDIRVKAEEAELELQKVADLDRYNGHVDQYNADVNDYNSSCQNKSFKVVEKPLATSQVETQRASLESEGRGRVG